MLTSVKSYSALSGNIWSVSKRKDVSFLTLRKIPPPFEQWSNLFGSRIHLTKIEPLEKNHEVL